MYSDIPTYPIASSNGANGANNNNASVLAQFPAESAHNVVINVVKSVSSQLSSLPSQAKLNEAENGAKTTLKTESQIVWFMEVVCHGLSLPLSEHETIKECVNVYCEWLSALLPNSAASVPAPVLEEPNRYARKMIGHLYHLFVPRKGEGKAKGGRKMVTTQCLSILNSYT